MIILAYLIATAIPLVFLIIVRGLDFLRHDTRNYVIFGFLWGGVAVALAGWLNQYLVNQRILVYDDLVRYGAPVIEEVIKAAVLIYLVSYPRSTYVADGTIHGFAAGMGFAIFENYFYLWNTPDAGIGLAVGRVLSANLIHASATALVAAALGRAVFTRGSRHWGSLLVGLVSAVALHGIFNNLVNRYTDRMILVYAAILGFLGTGLIVYMINRGLKDEMAWIERKLSEDKSIQYGERARVQKLADLQEVLDFVNEHFGPEKGPQIENFLYIQARLGSKRMQMEKFEDAKIKASIEKEVSSLEVEMEEARRQVGAYCMAYIRSVFPANTSPVYDLLRLRIEQQIANRKEDAPDYRDSLSQRIKSQAIPAPSAGVVEASPASDVAAESPADNSPKPAAPSMADLMRSRMAQNSANKPASDAEKKP